jgi:triosephosphate isomerase
MRKQRGILIAGNWKMNHGITETEGFFSSFQKLSLPLIHEKSKALFQSQQLRVCLIPPFLSLEKTRALATQFTLPLSVAAQNAHWEKKGAFTGEISGPMLKESGISWVLIGHSERRQFFGETDQTVRKRAESLLEQGFHVILCVGETRSERESNQTEAVLTRQIHEALGDRETGLLKYLNGQLIIAYEPVWAIGTGLTATPTQAEEAHEVIRKLIKDRMGSEAAAATPLLYGGSVTPENAHSLLSCHNVDGALVGGASLKPESLIALIQNGINVL